MTRASVQRSRGSGTMQGRHEEHGTESAWPGLSDRSTIGPSSTLASRRRAPRHEKDVSNGSLIDRELGTQERASTEVIEAKRAFPRRRSRAADRSRWSGGAAPSRAGARSACGLRETGAGSVCDSGSHSGEAKKTLMRRERGRDHRARLPEMRSEGTDRRPTMTPAESRRREPARALCTIGRLDCIGHVGLRPHGRAPPAPCTRRERKSTRARRQPRRPRRRSRMR